MSNTNETIPEAAEASAGIINLIPDCIPEEIVAVQDAIYSACRKYAERVSGDTGKADAWQRVAYELAVVAGFIGTTAVGNGDVIRRASNALKAYDDLTAHSEAASSSRPE